MIHMALWNTVFKVNKQSSQQSLGGRMIIESAQWSRLKTLPSNVYVALLGRQFLNIAQHIHLFQIRSASLLKPQQNPLFLRFCVNVQCCHI